MEANNEANRFKNIVILMYQYSVVVKGMENKLKELGYHVDVVTDKFELVKNFASNVSLFIFYLPADIMDDSDEMKILSQMTEKIIGWGNNMIIVGEKKYHDDLVERLPEIRPFDWVDRPVNMGSFCQLVEKTAGHQVNPLTQKRILIIDDDPSYAKMVREWIKDIYRVDIVTAGMQAISFLLKLNDNEKVDMILLDYEMPVVDGPQVLQMLRQEPATAGIPVIFLTGVGTKEAVGRVMELKPDGYILKTTTRNDLVKFLNQKLF